MQLYPLTQSNATVPVDGTPASCGVTTIWGLQEFDPAAIVDRVMRERHESDKRIREAFVVFSDVDWGMKNRGGYFLAKHIKENNIGTIMETESRMNPNTGNQIKVWVWSPPHASLNPIDKFMPKKGHRIVVDRFDRRFRRHALPDAFGHVELEDGEVLA